MHPPSETCTLKIMFKRHRRLRKNPVMRELLTQFRILPSDLVMPFFVKENLPKPCAIPSMPGQYQHTQDSLLSAVESAIKLGIRSFLLFGIPSKKTPDGRSAWLKKGILPETLRKLKSEFPDTNLFADVCLCEYTSHGHCGIMTENQIDNDATLKHLAETSLVYAQAGADVIAPSDMMDGRVLSIRTELDRAGFTELPICSYAVKFASPQYAPFRDAAENTPQGPDRASYQMDFRIAKESLSEAKADVEEGADLLLIKPAMNYLDVVADVSKAVPVPVGVYQVSGEYAMIKSASDKGWIDEERIVHESLIAAKRAGASFIVTYSAVDFASWKR